MQVGGAGNPSTVLNPLDVIELVKKRPVLWDRQCDQYKDRLRCKKAWTEVCEEIVPGYNEMKESVKQEFAIQVTKKWNNIRDNYLKCLKVALARNKRGKKSKPYIYARALTFLDANYYRLQPQSIDDQNDDDRNSDMESEPYMNEVYLDLDETETDPAKMVKTALTNDFNASVGNGMANILSSLIEREEDEDRAFFNSITPTVKQLSSDNKMEFRIQVLTLLKNLKKNESVKVMKEEQTDPIDFDDD